MKLFGVIPLGEHSIRTSKVVSRTPMANNSANSVTTGLDNWFQSGTPDISPWNAQRKTVYTDETAVKAGVLTPMIWLFAAIFYRYRQRRWRKLV